jgi:hypothetical protein
MRIILAAIFGLVGGGGVFAYGVWHAGDQDAEDADHEQ